MTLAQAPHYLVALDLEMNQPSGRVIQIGAVMGELESGREVSRFASWVCCDEELSPAISKLVGVRQTTLESLGVPLPDAYSALCDWLRPWNSERALNPLTWGGGDSTTLAEQLAGASSASVGYWPFGRRWLDVKTVYVAWQHSQGVAPVGGLARSMRHLGLSFQGQKHRADDDAWNTFRVYHHLLTLIANRRPQG